MLLEKLLDAEDGEPTLVIRLSAGEQERSSVDSPTEVATYEPVEITGKRILLRVPALRPADSDPAASNIDVLQKEPGHLDSP